MKQSKATIYEQYGIRYNAKTQKIYHNYFGWIRPLLINGNDKLGKGVWTYSTLATNRPYHVTLDTTSGPVDVIMRGTCPCACEKCYAIRGRYAFENVIQANARKTWLSRFDIDFMTRAIIAQINADHITICRIHASGDFDSSAYIDAWRRIVKGCPDTIFWTYTKNIQAENAFDDLSNINVVRSVIPGIGFNFGHCDYIIKAYNALKAIGKKVYICRCGIDKNQHCTNCHGCYENEIVLFVEHSTEYKAEKDPMYNELKQLIESQDIAVSGRRRRKLLTLVRTYKPGTAVFVTEKLYLFNNHVKAIERFRKEHPECKDLICMASGIDATDPKNAEFIVTHIKAYY